MLLIREEVPGDLEAIREVNRLAFGGEVEARLVDCLREDGLVVASLVALEDGRVAGHILFSHLPIETARGTVAAASLAPMSVLPELHRRGIGSRLVRRGLELCRESGVGAVVVVGHPDYYPRFGFSSERAQRLAGPFSGAAWMALELVPGALAGQGTVRYPRAFEIGG